MVHQSSDVNSSPGLPRSDAPHLASQLSNESHPLHDKDILLKQLLFNATFNEHDRAHAEHYNNVVSAIHLHDALAKHNSTHLYPTYRANESERREEEDDDGATPDSDKPVEIPSQNSRPVYQFPSTSEENTSFFRPPKASSMASRTAGVNYRTNNASEKLSMHMIPAPAPLLVVNDEVKEDDKKQKKRYEIAEAVLDYAIKAETCLSTEKKIAEKPENFDRDAKAKKDEKNDAGAADKPATTKERSASIDSKITTDTDVNSDGQGQQQGEESDDKIDGLHLSPPSASFWTTSEPPLPYTSAPNLPRPLQPLWTPTTYLNPQPRSLQMSFHPNDITAKLALTGDLVKAHDEHRKYLRQTQNSETFKGHFAPYFPKKHQERLQNRYGVYPLATRDRMDELRKEQAKQAWDLYKKYGDKWPWDDDAKKRRPLGREKVKKLWRRAFIYAKAIAALKVRPPKQQTRAELGKLLELALKATRKKIYFQWDSILGAFQIDAAAEKKRQRRLTMNLKGVVLKEPTGVDLKSSALLKVLRGPDTKCTKVEVVKLLAFAIGPDTNPPIDEIQAEAVHEYIFGKDKIPLSAKDDPLVSYKVFMTNVYPSAEEKAEWDEVRAKQIREEREKQMKDMKLKKQYEKQMEIAKSKAIAEVNDAWERSYFEVSNDLVEKIRNQRNEDPTYAASKFKSGWGERISEQQRRSLFHILSAGMEPPDVQTSTCRKKISDAIARNGGLVPHVYINPIRECMVNCIQNARGMDGLRPKEATEVILEYLAVRTQAAFRGIKKRRGIQKAMKMWKGKERALKQLMFTTWGTWALHLVAVRRYCARPYREWRKLVRKIKNAQMVFTACFWPYYVWRRWAAKRVMARKKAKMLKRVYATYFVMKHFGAWKRYSLSESGKSKKSFQMAVKLQHKLLALIARRWHRYAQRRAGIRVNWDRRGYRMRKEKEFEMLYVHAQVWRYFAFCNKEMRRRTQRYFRDYAKDNEDRRNHAVKLKEERLQLANQPRVVVEHTHNNLSADSDIASSSGGGGRRKTKTAAKNSRNSKRGKSSSSPKSSPHTPTRKIVHMGTAPANVISRARQSSLIEDHIIAGTSTLTADNKDYVAPVGDIYQFVKYGGTRSKPRTEEFPALTDLIWGASLPPDVQEICHGTYERFKVKDARQMKICYMMYYRSGPAAIQNLYDHVIIQKKGRYAINRAKNVFRRIYFNKFKDICLEGIAKKNMIFNDGKKKKGKKRGGLDGIFGGADEEEGDNEVPYSETGDDSTAASSVLNTGNESNIGGSSINNSKENDGSPTVAISTAEKLNADRAVRLAQMEKTFERCSGLQTYVQNKTEEIDLWNVSQNNRVTIQEQKSKTLSRFLEFQKALTFDADEVAQKYVSEFQVHAARKLFATIVKIREEVEKFNSVNIKWRYFRRIRLLINFKKMEHLHNRQKIRNWLRLCARYRYVERGMVVYKSLKDKWKVFNKWLRYLQKMYVLRSVGISQECTRRRRRLVLYDKFLVESKLFGNCYPYQTLNVVTTTRDALFYRWAKYVNKKATMRKISELSLKRYNYRFARRVFSFWKTGVKICNSFERRWANVPFLEGRCNADLECIRSRLITTWRGKISSHILVENKKRKKEVIVEAHKAPSFKKFIHGLRKDVYKRIKLEERMLIEAFEMRGKLEYADVCSLQFVGKGKQVSGGSMVGGGGGGGGSVASIGSGSVTVTKPGTARSVASRGTSRGGETQNTGKNVGGGGSTSGLKRFQDKQIPSGFGIGEVCVIMKQGQGVVGLTSIAKAEDKERELGKYGCYSIGIRETFVLKSEEQLVAVEISFGSVLERIKFHTSSGRASKWIGKKISATPHTTKLCASDSDIDNVLYPEDKYIVGFHGWESKTRIMGLGIINRVIIKQFVFSYYWLDDDADENVNDDSEDGENNTTRRRQNSGLLKSTSVAPTVTAGTDESDCDGQSLSIAEKEQGNNGEQQGDISKIDPGKEFASIVRMRRSDIESALERSERFARHLWTSRSVAMDWKLSTLARFQIVQGLTNWFFEAAAFRLENSFSSGEAEKLIYDGEEIKMTGIKLVNKAGFLRNKVDKDAVMERPWPVTGMLSPADRKKEKDYKLKLQAGWKKADELEDEGWRMQESGEEMVSEGKSLMPNIENSPAVMKYYANLIAVARRQIQLENDFGAEYFASVIRGEGGENNRGKNFPLDSNSFKALVGTVRCAAERHAESQKQMTKMLKEQHAKNAEEGKGGTMNDLDFIANLSMAKVGGIDDEICEGGEGEEGFTGFSEATNNSLAFANKSSLFKTTTSMAKLAARKRAAKGRALLPLPPSYVIDEAENRADLSFLKERSEGGLKLPEIANKTTRGSLKDNPPTASVFSDKKKSAREEFRKSALENIRKEKRMVEKKKDKLGELIQEREKLRQSYLNKTGKEFEIERREAGQDVRQEGDETNRFEDYFDDDYFDKIFDEEKKEARWEGDNDDGYDYYVVDVDDNDDFEVEPPIAHVPSYYERQMKRAKNLIKDPNRSFNLNKRINGLGSMLPKDNNYTLSHDNYGQGWKGVQYSKHHKHEKGKKKEKKEGEDELAGFEDFIDPTDEM